MARGPRRVPGRPAHLPSVPGGLQQAPVAGDSPASESTACGRGCPGLRGEGAGRGASPGGSGAWHPEGQGGTCSHLSPGRLLAASGARHCTPTLLPATLSEALWKSFQSKEIKSKKNAHIAASL